MVIVNGTHSAVAISPESEGAANPLVQAVREALEASPHTFEVTAEATGLEARACEFLDNGLPNRARMKVFSPKAGHTLIFFYKRSLVPYSRDRYSYGGIDLRGPAVEAKEIAEWLTFLTSGFHPDKRPSNFRRAFPYEVPE